MPNWVMQELHVVGPRREIDRFVRAGFIRRKRGEMDNLLDFERLCPLKRGDRRYTHESGVVAVFFRTYTQACFSMITSWDYPAAFYAGLARHWPSLAFACEIDEEMGSFGGVVTVLEGTVTNLVRDFDDDYDRRAHGREARALLGRWQGFLTDGRPWRLIPRPSLKGLMPFDAHFDHAFSFYFRSREDVARFKERYKSVCTMRRVGRTWQPARVRSRS